MIKENYDLIFDNHVHIQKNGRNIEALKLFERAGGTHINICNVPDYTIPYNENYYEKIYQNTLELTKKARSETSLKIYVTLGPYPVDIVRAVESGMSLKTVVTLMRGGIDMAAKEIENGNAIAIGEVGRPHFSVPDKIWIESNNLIRYAFEKAKDTGAAVVMHTESPTPDTFKEFAVLADSVGIEKDKVVKHYSPAFVTSNLNYGIFPSIIASRSNVREAFKQGYRFFLETDYVDDPSNFNKVMSIDTVPKRVRMAVSENLVTYEKLYDTVSKYMRSVYSIDVD